MADEAEKLIKEDTAWVTIDRGYRQVFVKNFTIVYRIDEMRKIVNCYHCQVHTK